MKFLCPNCSAKYRIGPEKLLGRPAAKIRCRKCDYRIHITRKGADEWDVTAIPAEARASIEGSPSVVPAAARAPLHQPPPTGAVPGLPGIQPGGGVSGGGRARPGEPPGERAQGHVPQLSPPRVVRPGPPRASVRRSPKVAGRPGGLVSGKAAPSPEEPGVRTGSPALRELVQQGLESSQASQPTVAEEDWFVGVNGVPLGPIPLGELKQLVSAGHVDGRSLVWRDGWPQWKALRKVEGLSRVLEGAEPTDGLPAPHTSSNSAPSLPDISTSAPPLPTETAGLHATETGGGPPGPSPTATAWDDLDDDGEEPDEMATVVQDRPFGTLEPEAMSEVGVGAMSGVVGAEAMSEVGVGAPALTAPSARAPASASAGPDPQRSRAFLAFAGLAVLAVLAVILVILNRARHDSPPEPSATSALPVAGDDPIRVVRAEELPTSPGSEVAEPQPTEAAAKKEPPRSKPRKSGGGPTAPRARQRVEKASNDSDLMAGLGGLQTPGPAAPEGGSARTTAATGQLDAATINRVVRRHQPSLKRGCWREASATREPGAPAAARFQVEVEVSPAGKVTQAKRKEDAKGYPGLALCVERKVRAWRFPRSRDSTTVTIPFVFVGQ